MTTTDLIALIVTILGVASFAAVVTILFRNYIRSAIKEISLGNRDIEIVDLMVYELDEKVVKKKKAINITKNIAYYTLLTILIPVFGLSLYSRIKGNVTKIGNNSVMVVASGSMSQKNEANDYLFTYNLNNQFNTYDMIVLTGVKSTSQLGLYDVIAYRNDKGINVIHRIIAIDYSEGNLRYTTRGDSNSATDSYRPTISDVIGKYTGKRIPSIGIFIMFFQSYAGIVTILSVIYCSIMISHFSKKLDAATDERRQSLANLFDINNINENDTEQMKSYYAHTIFYKGFAYETDSDNKINKREMTEDEKSRFQSEDEPIKIENIEPSAEDEEKENDEQQSDSSSSEESSNVDEEEIKQGEQLL